MDNRGDATLNNQPAYFFMVEQVKKHRCKYQLSLIKILAQGPYQSLRRNSTTLSSKNQHINTNKSFWAPRCRPTGNTDATSKLYTRLQIIIAKGGVRFNPPIPGNGIQIIAPSATKVTCRGLQRNTISPQIPTPNQHQHHQQTLTPLANALRTILVKSLRTPQAHPRSKTQMPKGSTSVHSRLNQ